MIFFGPSLTTKEKRQNIDDIRKKYVNAICETEALGILWGKAIERYVNARLDKLGIRNHVDDVIINFNKGPERVRIESVNPLEYAITYRQYTKRGKPYKHAYSAHWATIEHITKAEKQ